MKIIKIGDVSVNYEVVYGKYRTLSMKYSPSDKKLVVHASRRISSQQIEKFLNDKQSWILKQVQKPWKYLHINETVDVFGKNYPVKVVLSNRNVVVLDDVCTIYTKKTLSKDEIEKCLKRFLKQCLQEYIDSIYDEVSTLTKVKDVTIRYRYMTSRFGVCYPKRKEICMNTYLACMSKDSIRAVLLHEYAHFYQTNHSQSFYDVVYRFCPTYEKDMLHLKYVVLQ